MSEETLKEKQQIAVTKLELKFTEFLNKKKKEVLYNSRARGEIEKMRLILLDERTLAMFVKTDLVTDYTNLLNNFNKVLDGDLS